MLFKGTWGPTEQIAIDRRTVGTDSRLSYTNRSPRHDMIDFYAPSEEIDNARHRVTLWGILKLVATTRGSSALAMAHLRTNQCDKCSQQAAQCNSSHPFNLVSTSR